MKKEFMRFQWILLTVLAFCLGSCKDDNNADPTTVPFDPSKPVVITDFTPKEGGAYQKLLITGSNFGNDKAKTKVMIGGKQATLINVRSNNIYCFVPSGAFDGDIVVSIGEGDNVVTGKAETNFDYQEKMVVGTLCGFRNNNDDQGWKDGPFKGPDNIRASGFANAGYLAIDPQNRKHLYITYDGQQFLQLIDMEKEEVRTVNTLPNTGSRVRSVCFNPEIKDYDGTTVLAKEGQYMVIAIDADHSGEETPSVYIMERNAQGNFEGVNPQLIASYRQCNGAAFHPDGQLYFNSYQRGQVFRLEIREYFHTIKEGKTWNPIVKQNPAFTELFTIADPEWEFQLNIHPTGKFAYLNVINRHYYMRSDYDEKNQRFLTPYNFLGYRHNAGYVDAVGTDARVNGPRQGVFVYNPEYAGREDEYDFYFVDAYNFCVRKITPEGIVSTYAGRGASTSLADGNAWGTDDGDLREVARFRDVSGIAYDETTETFYVHDWVGHTIRTISMEKRETETSEEPEENPDAENK